MPNTNIPLQVKQVDVANPLMILAQRERQEKQDQRQSGIDALAATESGQRQQVNDLQIQQLKQQLEKVDPQLLKQGLQSIAVDSIAVQELLKNGDAESAALLAQGIKATSSTLGLPSQEVDNFINLLGNNPQAASQYWDRQVDVVRQNMPAIFTVEKDAQGNPVAQRNSQTGQLLDVPKGMQPNGGQQSLSQFGGQIEVKDEAGNLFFATTSRDPSTGQAKTVLSPISGDQSTQPQGGLRIVGQFGETGSERTGRAVDEATGTTAARELETRASDLMTRGVAAAESTATIRRAISLLDVVETGGPEAFALAVKQGLGIEGADEGELSNTLGKSVLSQLRETFGAAFTENEGNRLARIEASFNKSPATNKRLLGQALRIAENTARRASEAAKERGQNEVVADIEDLLTFDLGIDPQSAQQDAGAQTATNPQTGERIILRNGKWEEL